MAIIVLKTFITAPIEICFDLSRNIDLHLQSMQSSGEEAIAGRQSGLITYDETVTWKAKHFKMDFTMKVRITKMKYPEFFVDEMVSGPFKKLHHQHLFKISGTETEMTDIFEFVAPAGILGRFITWLILEKYMKKLLIERNQTIKAEAEKC
ncbi:cell division protein [Pedobacter petrophilus]|uniref:Cell division protein n=1 Tax=Pedobacter petrophilus TaxID=1908241 RepID=A0A7K0FYY2_9SPHI|nr:SRPBCC family protein [Pedobacter petrophilus]MRX76725.1 cell division protein [Pedobacter petrophilus]